MTESIIDIATAAEKLARANAESESSIVKILWFPHEDQIRLIEVDKSSMAFQDDEIHPYYFSAVADIPYVSAIALISPEQEKRLQLPLDWGTWESAVVVFDRERPAA